MNNKTNEAGYPFVPNAKVIIISNYNQPLKTGEFVRFDNRIPIVKTHHNGEVLVMGIIIPYTDEMYHFLNALPRNKQWEIMSQIVTAVQSRIVSLIKY